MGADLWWDISHHRPRSTLAYWTGRTWEIYKDEAITGYVRQKNIPAKDITERALKILNIKIVTERPNA
jgi:hypothetical protein